MKNKCHITAIITSSGKKWGISFNGHPPAQDDLFDEPPKITKIDNTGIYFTYKNENLSRAWPS